MVALSSTLNPPSSVELSALVAAQRTQDRLGICECVERALQDRSGSAWVKTQAVGTIYEASLLGISTQIRDGVPLSAIKEAITALMGTWDALLIGELSPSP
jgi:hypothetical protein